MSQAIVEMKNVSKSFGTTAAIENLSMEIKEGEFFSLLGTSGCGKTTLLRMIAGFEFPGSGTVSIAGQDMSRVAPHRRPVNMVFQSYALFPHLTVFENIAFGLRMSKTQIDGEIKERVGQALNLVRLPAIMTRYPRELSGGQQQRVAFARAIVNKPKVLLLDEPLSALDPKIRLEMQAELARFKKELNMTFVMVTHDQGEAFALSDRIAVLSAGNLEQLASPEELFENPKTPFVADFIGQTNLLRGEIIELDPPFCQVAGANGISIWADISQHDASKLTKGSKVTVWLRSSAFSILELEDEVRSNELLNRFEVEIIHRSFQGTFCDYHIKMSPDLFWNASLPNVGIVHQAGQRKLLTVAAKLAQVIPE